MTWYKWTATESPKGSNDWEIECDHCWESCWSDSKMLPYGWVQVSIKSFLEPDDSSLVHGGLHLCPACLSMDKFCHSR